MQRFDLSFLEVLVCIFIGVFIGGFTDFLVVSEDLLPFKLNLCHCICAFAVSELCDRNLSISLIIGAKEKDSTY